jgi:hypothetical protein
MRDPEAFPELATLVLTAVVPPTALIDAMVFSLCPFPVYIYGSGERSLCPWRVKAGKERRPAGRASSLSDLMGRSEKSGRRGQFFTGFKRIVVLFAQKHGEK